MATQGWFHLSSVALPFDLVRFAVPLSWRGASDGGRHIPYTSGIRLYPRHPRSRSGPP